MNDHIYTDRPTIDRLTAHLSDLPPLSAVIDGVGLKCPMPLLKVKIALRAMADGACLYVVADDPNAGVDLGYFCQKQGHKMTSWQGDDGNFNAFIYKNTQ